MDRMYSLVAPPEPDNKSKHQPLENVMATLVRLRAKIKSNDSHSDNQAASSSGGNWYEWGNLDDDEAERVRCKQWVARIARLSATRWMDSPSDAAVWEPVMELAYDIQALLDGYGVSKKKYRNIALWNNDGSRIANSDGGINVQELGFEQADIGGETWNASIVLARKIARGAVDVTGHRQCIELGCGTGLLGFTVAHVFAESSGIGYSNASMKSDRVVVMTDYLPTIMAAVEEGAKKNGFFDSGLVKPALLDWFGIVEQAQLMKDRDHVPLPRTHYLSESEINDLPNDHVTISNLDPAASKGCFDLVVAADVLYEVEHCLVIPRLVDFLLAPAPDHNAGTGDLTVIPKFIVTTSLRITHWAEVAAFEAEMASIPSLVLLSKHDSSRLSDMEEWVETLGVSHAAMVEEAQDKWTDLQKSMDQDKEEGARHYRTYMFGRQALA